MINSCRDPSGRMLDRKSAGAKSEKIAFVTFEGILRIWTRRMTKKRRRANFLSRVWSLVEPWREFCLSAYFSFETGVYTKRIMPRRTVQEVTVQDVQKRRTPNKHYVSVISTSPTVNNCLIRSFYCSFPFPVRQSKNKERIKFQPTKSVERNSKELLIIIITWKLNDPSFLA